MHRGLAALRLALAAMCLPFAFSLSPARADLPAHALLTRRLAAAPAGADAVRFSVYGDNSGARVQARLLALGTAQDVGAYFAAPPVRVDFTGWKTVIIPLADFTFQSEQNPEAAAPARSAVDNVQFAITAVWARIYLDDLAWTKAGASPTDAPLQVIDGFETAPTAWRVSGSYDQMRAVAFTINRAAPFVKSGGGSLQILVRSRAAGEKQLYGSALLARLKRGPLPYVIYARPPFEAIVPDSTPAPAEVQAQPRLSLSACTEETEPATFAVYAGRDLKDATVTVASEFLSESRQSRLPRTALDLHVVKVWEQAGLKQAGLEQAGLEQDGVASVPELLVKDDRTPLTGPAPAVRLTGNPQTDIPAGTSKQFWITVRVPKGQPVAVYTGRLLFSALGAKPTSVTLSVEILPMRLRTAFLQYGIDFRSRLSAEGTAPGEPVVTPEVFARQLADIHDHGFKFVSLYDSLPALADAMKLYKEAALSRVGPVIVMSPVKKKADVENIEDLRTKIGLGPDFDIYYGMPIAPAGVGLDAAKGRFAMIHKASRKAYPVAPVVSQSVYEALGQGMDASERDKWIPVYNVASEYPQKLLSTGKRETSNRDWWSWNIARASPLMNRLYAGYLLYRTGINGAGLYGAFPGPYPSGLNGTIVDTLQWEAAREGIDDIRYITNLKTYLRDVKDLKIRKDVTDEAEAFLQKAMTQPLAALPPGEIQAIRRGIANEALKLLTILRGNAPLYPD